MPPSQKVLANPYVAGQGPLSYQHNNINFTVGYVRPSGELHEFDLANDPHFKNLRSAQSSGEWGQYDGVTDLNAPLGKNLRTAAQQNLKGHQAVQGLGFEWVQEDRALFLQGIDLYRDGNAADNALLRQLQYGQITPGHPDYAKVRALAEQRFTLAYAAQVEYDRKTQFTKEGAKYQADQLQLNGFDANKLFNSGLNLFDKKGDPEQERLLGMLQRGELKPGDARYAEIRGLAEARYKVAYQQALEPPPKTNWLKTLVAVVIAAVVTFYTAGAASGWVAGALSTTTTVSVGVGTAGIAAASVGTAIGAYAGTVISTGIQTGSLSKAMRAGENSLKGSLAKVAVELLAAQLGLPTGGVSGFALSTVGSAVSNVAMNGGDFGQALVQGAINAGVEMLAQDTANQIGNSLPEGSVENYLAHGLLGCASASARGGNSDACGAGAAGAMAGNWAGQAAKENLKSDSPNEILLAFNAVPGQTIDSTSTFFAGLAGGTTGALVGKPEDVQNNFNYATSAAKNAFENNFLKHEEANALAKEMAACKAKAGGCPDAKEMELRDKYILASNKNIEDVQKKIISGDVEGVETLLDSAADAAQVRGLFTTRQDEQIFVGRQDNVNNYGAVKGNAALSNDVERAQQVREFRQSSCAGLSSSACDGLVNQAMDDQATRAWILTGIGLAVPLVARGVQIGAQPNKAGKPAVASQNTGKPDNMLPEADFANRPSGVNELAAGKGGGANGGGKVAGAVDDVAATGRPTPRQSEIDVGVDLPSGARPQVSFKNGQEVPYGTSGSVRPDYCLGNVCSVEVKNYNITTNSNGLINNVSQQAIDRAANLPSGMTQKVVIDVRGQVLTPAQENVIRVGIVQKSNGAISPTSISFKR